MNFWLSDIGSVFIARIYRRAGYGSLDCSWSKRLRYRLLTTAAPTTSPTATAAATARLARTSQDWLRRCKLGFGRLFLRMRVRALISGSFGRGRRRFRHFRFHVPCNRDGTGFLLCLEICRL